MSANRVIVSHHRLSTMTTSEADQLFGSLTEIVACSMTPGIPPEESWAVAEWSDRRADIVSTDDVLIARVGDQIEGFVTYRSIHLHDRPAVFIGAACVRPEWQSHGLGFAMNLQLLLRAIVTTRLHGFYLVARTMNPVAMHGWRKQLLDPSLVWPPLGDTTARPHLERAARSFVEHYEPFSTFDPATGVLKGRHGPGPRSVQPSGCPEVDEHFRTHVDSERGDTVLMVIDGARSVLARHALRTVARVGRYGTQFARGTVQGSRNTHDHH